MASFLFKRPLILPLLFGGMLIGCGSDQQNQMPNENQSSSFSSSSQNASEPQSSSSESSSEAALTYWQDIAPLMYEHCAACHVEGGAAPFVLTNYDSTRLWASFALEAVEERSMPPWLVTDDGSCGSFSHSRWMPDEDIATFRAWVEGDQLEGEPRSDLQLAALPELINPTIYTSPDFRPEIQGGALAEFDEYRCFLVDNQLDKDQFLVAYDVEPGNAPMVHHAILFSVDPNETSANGNLTNAEQIAALQASSPDREGWPCFGSAGAGVEIKGAPVSWAPGQGANSLPDGTGFKISKDDLVIIQVHYNLANMSLIGQTDSTKIKVQYEDTVAREGFFLLPDPLLSSLSSPAPHTLAPGMENEEYTWQMNFNRYLAPPLVTKLDLYGVFPHMHERGKKLHATITHAGGLEQCIADVQHWDFEWQLYYFHQQPIEVERDEVLEVTCTYDTSDATSPVLPGWGTHNEMCLLGLFVVPQIPNAN